MHDSMGLEGEQAAISALLGQHDAVRWRAHWTIDKFDDPTGAIGQALEAGADLDAFADQLIEHVTRDGNLLMYGGASCLWQCLLGNGTGTGGQALTFFNNGNAAIGVGDSTTAAAATQTDLQAATNKLRKAMDATYPSHTDGTGSGAATVTFRATFGSSDANFAWQEWIVANSPTAGTGRALNRKVESLGTKASGTTWVFTVTLTLA